ncbi:6241_t:CDS:2, partial [Scutellospora calospora]
MIIKIFRVITLFVITILQFYLFVNATPIFNPSNSGIIKIPLTKSRRSDIDPVLLSLLKRDPQATIPVNYHVVRYTASILIGGQPLTILFDTGSDDLWVPSVYCTSTSCTNSTLYDPRKSSTYKEVASPNNFTIRYGSGVVSGYTGQETVKLGGISITQQIFGLATSVTTNSYSDGGIMGISFFQSNAPGVVQTMKAQKVINKALVGFSYTGTDNNNYVTFGDVPNEYANSISYNKVVDNTTWQILLSDITVDGTSLGIRTNALVDAGSTLMYGSSQQVSAIHSKISGSSNNSNIWWIPCNTKSVISLVIGGISYDINPTHMARNRNSTSGLCRSGIQAQPSNVNANFFSIGQVFLNSFFAAFDIDNKQIGFAKTV